MNFSNIKNPRKQKDNSESWDMDDWYDELDPSGHYPWVNQYLKDAATQSVIKIYYSLNFIKTVFNQCKF